MNMETREWPPKEATLRDVLDLINKHNRRIKQVKKTIPNQQDSTESCSHDWVDKMMTKDYLDEKINELRKYIQKL